MEGELIVGESQRLYAIPMNYKPHKDIVTDQCFGECGKLVLGIVEDDVVGTCWVCRQDDCPYEHEDTDTSHGTSDDVPVFFRRLGPKHE